MSRVGLFWYFRNYKLTLFATRFTFSGTVSVFTIYSLDSPIQTPQLIILHTYVFWVKFSIYCESYPYHVWYIISLSKQKKYLTIYDRIFYVKGIGINDKFFHIFLDYENSDFFGGITKKLKITWISNHLTF